MIVENLSVSKSEEKILKSLIGKTLLRASTMNPYSSGLVSIQPVHLDFGDVNYEITRNEVVIQYFDIREDAAYPMIHEAEFQDFGFVKNINRIVKDVLIAVDIFEFSDYKITYPKAFIFSFDDCNFIVEKIWLISLTDMHGELTALNEENFGLTDEMQFWYDPELSEEKPLATQEIKSLKLNKIISVMQI